MIEGERRRVHATFAVSGTEEDRIRDLEERLQRLRLAGRLAACRLAADLPRSIARRIRAPRPARSDGGAWLAVRALWARLLG